MPGVPSACATAVDSVAEAYPAPDLGDITSAKDLIQAFNLFSLNGSGVRNVNEAPQRSQNPQLPAVVASTHIQTPINGKPFKLDIKTLVDNMSSMEISRPAPKSAKRLTPQVHPYKRPALTKADKILSSHGMVKKGAPTAQDMLSSGRIKSVASTRCIKMNNATLSLLSNSPSSPNTFDSPFNWSTAWLSRGCARSSSPPTIETQVYITPDTNTYSGTSSMEDIVISAPAIVKGRKPSKETGKIKKSRLPKTTPYSKDKAERRNKAEPPLSKFDAEVASLADMLSHCQLSNGSNGNARLTRSKARAARKAEACHDSGYEGGLED